MTKWTLIVIAALTLSACAGSPPDARKGEPHFGAGVHAGRVAGR